MKGNKCFGFYTGEWQCREGSCKCVVQCKAVANSDSLDVVSDVIEELSECLPNQDFLDTNSVRVLTEQLIYPIKVLKALEVANVTPVENVLNPDFSKDIL